MATDWYVLYVYSGYENRIEKTVRRMLGTGELSGEIVRDVKIPSEEVVEVRDGKKHTTTRKILPGYILIELDLPEKDWKITCSTIKNIQGVTDFVGRVSTEEKPRPLSGDEARGILQKMGGIKGERPVRARQSFVPGEKVKIIEGPFESFTGTVEEVNQEKNKLKVMVGIFGRNTPVEVDLLQVEKL
ncbi:transcription termination/antitermination protein NusG [Spirochaetia bacterium]|nr:transcription termination/antitermination protein NusG [Spirochaetia bacterium]